MKSFEAIADDNGERITVLEIETWIEVPRREDPHAVLEGLKELVRADTNGHLNQLQDGRLQEASSGRIFHHA